MDIPKTSGGSVQGASSSHKSNSRAPKVPPGQNGIAPSQAGKSGGADSITEGSPKSTPASDQGKPAVGVSASQGGGSPAASAPATTAGEAASDGTGAAAQDPNAAGAVDGAQDPQQAAITDAVNTALQGFPPELVQMFMLIAQAYVQKLQQDPGTPQTQAAAAQSAAGAVANNPVVEDPQQRAQLAGAVYTLIQQLNSAFGSDSGSASGNQQQAQTQQPALAA